MRLTSNPERAQKTARNRSRYREPMIALIAANRPAASASDSAIKPSMIIAESAESRLNIDLQRVPMITMNHYAIRVNRHRRRNNDHAATTIAVVIMTIIVAMMTKVMTEK